MTTTTLREIAQMVLTTGASLAQLAGESRDYTPEQRREIAARELAMLDMRAGLLLRGEGAKPEAAPPWPGSWRPESLEQMSRAGEEVASA